MRKYLVIGGWENDKYVGPVNLIQKWGIKPEEAHKMAEEEEYEHTSIKLARNYEDCIILRVDPTGEYNLERECESQRTRNGRGILRTQTDIRGSSVLQTGHSLEDRSNTKRVSKRTRNE